MSAILVARKEDEFSRILAASGYKVFNLPLIETKVLDDLSDFEKKLAAIETYDGIFLTSAQSAQIIVEIFRKENIHYSGKVYVLGKRSYEILKDGNLDIVFDKNVNTVREFLEKISPEELKNRRFLYIRGEKSLRVVSEFLGKIAEVEETIVYETREIAIEIDKIKELREKFEQDEIVVTCFFSPSQAANFIKQFGTKVLQQTLIATIGNTTAEFFESQNLKVSIVSSKATATDFAVELMEFLDGKTVENNRISK